MPSHFDVVGLGQCSLDYIGSLQVYPALDQKAELGNLLVQGGGPVATALVVLSRLGVNTSFLGRIGGDEQGEQIREGLEGEGVDCQGLSVDPKGSSQVAFIVVDASGHRNIFWHRGSAKPLDSSEINTSLVTSAAILHLDGLQVDASFAAAKMARKHGVVTVLDGGTMRAGTLELLPLIDHLVVSEKFARQFCQKNDPNEALPQLLGSGAKAATITLGRCGSLTMDDQGSCFKMPAFQVDTVDTTGCGDVFHGAYIYGLLQNWSVVKTVRFAAACAALKCRAFGGRTAIPSRSEVRTFLDRNTAIQPVFMKENTARST
jgi:ribokinase